MKIQALKNSTWMLAEQILRLISGVFVGIYIARHLGPESYGTLSYTLAIASIIIVISRLGMDAILVREISLRPESKETLTSTALALMAGAGLLSLCLTVAALQFSNETAELKSLITIISTSGVFTAFLAVDYQNQALLNAKLSSICKTAALASMSIYKLTLIALNAKIEAFVIASVLDHALLALFISIPFLKKNKIHPPSAKLAIKLLKNSIPMVVSALAIIVYMRTDQIMIKHFSSLHEVGIYSAAVKIYESWIIIPYTIAISLIPLLTRIRQEDKTLYYEKLSIVFRYLTWLSIIASTCIFLLSDQIISSTFGPEFLEAASLMKLLIWASVLSTIGAVTARHLSIEHLERKIASRALLGAMLNISANLIAIPAYGSTGAAISTLLTLFVTNYLIDILDPKLKLLARSKNNGIFFLPILEKPKN